MKTALYVPEICESLDASRGIIRQEVQPPQRAADGLPRQSAIVQVRTEESEARASTVMHRLKSPLSAIIVISNAIFNVTDLTPEEFYEYLQQIRANAYKMDEIINNLPLNSEVP